MKDNSSLERVSIGDFLKNKCQDPKFTKKIFVISALVNICIYWFCVLLYYDYTNFLLLFADLDHNFFMAVQTFLIDPKNLYNYPTIPFMPNSVIFTSRWPFRSLPLLVFYYLPFYLIYLNAGINVSGWIYGFTLIIWNLLSCFIIYKITKIIIFKNEQGTGYFRNSFTLMSIFLLSMNQVGNYQMGQTNIIAGFFMLVGIYYYYQKKEHLTYMAWSIAAIFKIFVAVLIPFFIFQGPFKRFIKNAYYFLFPQILTILMFVIWPNWILEAWVFNWNTVVSWPIYISGSLARELAWWFSIPIIPLVIGVFCLIFLVNFWIAYKNKEISFIDRIVLGFITIIVCIPDLIANDELTILGIYVLWISLKSTVMTKKTKILMGIPTVFALATGVLFIVTINFPVPTLSIYYILCLACMYSNLLKARHINAIFWHRYDVIIGISAVSAFALSECLILIGVSPWIFGTLLLILILESTIPLVVIFIYQNMFAKKRLLNNSVNYPP